MATLIQKNISTTLNASVRLLLVLFFVTAVALISRANDSVDAAPADVPQLNNATKEVGSLLPHLDRPLSLSHFTWGADAGASIDLGGNDMSTFDVDAYFGYKGRFIRTAAIGSGIHKAFGNQYTFIPVYAMVRTSFRSKPSLLFMEVKAGYSFNTLDDSGSQGGFYGNVGVGINLAMSPKFNSHIVLSYGYFGLKKAQDTPMPYDGSCINYAVLRFGVNF